MAGIRPPPGPPPILPVPTFTEVPDELVRLVQAELAGRSDHTVFFRWQRDEMRPRGFSTNLSDRLGDIAAAVAPGREQVALDEGRDEGRGDPPPAPTAGNATRYTSARATPGADAGSGRSGSGRRMLASG